MQVSSARASGTDKAKSRLSAKMTPESARLPTKAQLPRRDPFVAVKFLRQKRRLDIPDRSGKRQSMSVLEAQFALRVRVAQLPEPLREYRFDADRRWKFDSKRRGGRNVDAGNSAGGVRSERCLMSGRKTGSWECWGACIQKYCGEMTA